MFSLVILRENQNLQQYFYRPTYKYVTIVGGISSRKIALRRRRYTWADLGWKSSDALYQADFSPSDFIARAIVVTGAMNVTTIDFHVFQLLYNQFYSRESYFRKFRDDLTKTKSKICEIFM